MSIQNSISGGIFTPLHDKVFVTDLERGPMKTKSGIIIPDDNMSERGIRPRWGKVYAVGPDNVDIKVGEWILVEHGRWTDRIELDLDDGRVVMWRVDFPDAVLLSSSLSPFNGL